MKSDAAETTREIVKFLDSIPLFSRITDASAHSLANASKFQYFEKGEMIFCQSDPSEAAYVVHTGNISIVLLSLDGREMIINEMHSGDVFGELGILTRKPRSTSAIAQSHSQLLVIPRQVFLQIMDEDPYLARLVLEITANRLQMSGQRESALAFMDAQARLARLLLELDKQEQEKGYVTISQEELAQRTGLIRQTVAKALGKWRRAGWLITGRGHFLLLDRKALKQMEKNLLV
jgi:CRP/FNR family transcriptional regulator, cyclic AMP receptor protein